MSATTLKIENSQTQTSTPTSKMLSDAKDQVASGDGDIVLDFSAIDRIEPDSVLLMNQLAEKAEEKSVKVTLRGVNVDVYKVLKLVKLAHRFAFSN